MITMEVNGRKLKAETGDTILQTLRRNNIKVPALCYMDNLTPTGACRLCVVEVEGMPNLVPSCSYAAQEGMKIKTHSPRVLRARKTIIELLLSNHPDDCLYCRRSGECELQKLAVELGVRNRRYVGEKNNFKIDLSGSSIVRDPSKCILCGRCVRMCEEIQGVSAIDFVGRGCQTRVTTAFDQGVNVSACVNCGQCINVCPTGALTERSSAKEVMNALHNPEKLVVVQHAPSVSVTIGEEFGFPQGVDVCGVMTAALRLIGFDRVFDTAFAADLTIMEEASELVQRIKNGGALPMFSSCSPGWIKFTEQFYPEFLPNLSSCKSPQQMLGTLIKTWYAEKQEIDPANIFSVSIMPCTAKKFEAQRVEMSEDRQPDIDAVLTTREMARMIRLHGLDMKSMDPEQGNPPFSARSTAGKIFGVSGGVTEAAIRTAHYLITGKELPAHSLNSARGLDGVKEITVDIGSLTLKTAVVNGLLNARNLLEQIKQGRSDLHFVEVMTCPGGCIGGGGQPINMNPEAVRARMKALYNIDRRESIRTSHGNDAINQIYKEFLGAPLSKKSHKLLHTSYSIRDTVS